MKVMKFREPDHIYPASLSATEQDLLALVLCDISKHKGINEINLKNNIPPKPLPYLFVYSEEEMLKYLDCNLEKLRKTIEPAAVNLANKKGGYSDKKGFDCFSLFGRANYEIGGDFVIEMLPSVVEMISNYDGYSEMDFIHFISLKKNSTKRIFREINRFKTLPNKKFEWMTLEDFKEMTGSDRDSYLQFRDFKKKLIPMFKNLLDVTENYWIATDNKKLGYELKKTGRYYTHIRLCLKCIDRSRSNKNLTELDAIITYSDISNGKLVTLEQVNNLTKHLGTLFAENKITMFPEFHSLFLQVKEDLEASK